MTLRIATAPDVPALVRVINRAYIVEQFFVHGERTTDAEIRERMARPGAVFLVLEDAAGVAGAIYVRVKEGRGFFAMLSVDPDRQKQGLGRRLVDAAAEHCRAAGCAFLDLDVVNLREELPPFYHHLGFESYGTAAFHEPAKLKRRAHLILMTKALAIAALVVCAAGCRKSPPPPAPAPVAAEALPPPGTSWDPWQDAQSRGIDFRAVGNEPGWFLEIDNERWMRLLYAYGERQATVPVAKPVVNGEVTTMESSGGGHTLRVDVRPATCSDGMSDQSYPLAVSVTIDGTGLNGCGRWLK